MAHLLKTEHALPKQAGDKKYWGQLYGGAKALAIAEQVANKNHFHLVVCDNSAEAMSLEEQIQFFSEDVPILHFPDWETLPYDSFSPHEDIISERLACLQSLQALKHGVLLVPVHTLMQRIAPPSFISQHSFSLKTGDILEIEDFRRQLEQANYHCVDNVYQHGEFALRGGLIDIFPMGSDEPYRIELFDIEVEQIKRFSTETQRSIASVDSIQLMPAKEFPLDKQALATFEDNWYEFFPDTSLKETHFYQDINQGLAFSGIEYYLPLFFEKSASLFDYLPKNSRIISTENIEANSRTFYGDVESRYQQYNVDRKQPLLPPSTVFLNDNDLFSALKQFPRVVLTEQIIDNPDKGFYCFDSQQQVDISIDAKAQAPYHKLQQLIASSDSPLLFCAESLGRKDVLIEIFKHLKTSIVEVSSWQEFLELKPSVGLTVSPISEGLHLNSCQVFSEAQLFGQRVQQRRRRKSQRDNSELVIKSLTELKLGAPVVHIDHGIGRYLGLKIIEVDGRKEEFLNLQYADKAMLYVPVASLHLISRYSGADGDNAPLHRLGTEQWQKSKKKAAEKAHDVAAELLDIYSRRAARKGFSFTAYSEAYQLFASQFPFEETEDQLSAIKRVLEDMASEQPMDRLVCGDVGFGKTEVAMRAAFTAVHNNKQVAVLVPTTLLAEQHYQSFLDRFADMPVNIDVLSRFKSAKEQKQALERLEAGKTDIMIGTHKLLQRDVKFKDLGLIIIDEEHRFGVKQKESLKAMRTEVDVLALTATPIPRTLNMSMAGMRDLSIIATAPAKRISIKTFVRAKENNLIKEAILRELLRGGQVYYLHNEVKTIENVARELQALIPEARIGIGHGQMPERELESVMSDFYHKRFNILLCTTIIETGIDVPNANTMIIDRADKFGLAQLHQLRGRVGRSHHQAYAYLLTPAEKKLSRDAEKRLEAISESSHLGAGFTLATHDLEIRGAGELLGDDQSGQIHSIGFSLYMQMLEQAVKALQSGDKSLLEQPLKRGTEVNLHIPAIIPDDYLPDVHTRLSLYKTIANCENKKALDECKIDIIDRFGLLPEPLQNLFSVTEVKLKAQKLGIDKIDLGNQYGRFEFANNTPVDPMNLVKLVQQQPQIFKIDGSSTLKCKLASETVEQRLQLVDDILQSLQGN